MGKKKSKRSEPKSEELIDEMDEEVPSSEESSESSGSGEYSFDSSYRSDSSDSTTSDKERSLSFGDDNGNDAPTHIADDDATEKPLVDWDNLTEEQQQIYDRYKNDRNRRMKALSEQKFHLPGGTWKSDWYQYFANNHPVFGICFHFPEHPIGPFMRFMCFLSSVVFGLCLTNLFWLWARESDKNETLFTVDVGSRPGSNLTQYVVDVDENNQVQVTPDMALLWTVGGVIHGSFDNIIWTLSICACCEVGAKYEHLAKYKKFGVGLLAFFIILIMALTTLTVVVRGVIESSEEQEDAQVSELKSAGVFDDALDLSTSSKDNYEFMLSFTVELAMAMLVYFPLLGTIFMWGGLGCFRYPMFGGRPYEMLEERRELEELLLHPEDYESPNDFSNSEWGDEPSEKAKDDLSNWWKRKDTDSSNTTGGPSIWNCWQCFRMCRKNEDETGYPKAHKKSTRYDSSTGVEIARENFLVRSNAAPKNKNANTYPSVNKSSSRYASGSLSSSNYPSLDKKASRYDSNNVPDVSDYPSADKKASRYDAKRGSSSDYPSVNKKASRYDSKVGSSASDYPSVNKKASRYDSSEGQKTSKSKKKAKKSKR